MKRIFACRPGCYDLSVEDAAKELAKLGVINLEVKFPQDGDYASLVEKVKNAGCSMSSLSGGLAVGDPESRIKLEQAIEAAGHFAIPVIFMSVTLAEGKTYDDGIALLQIMGEKAAKAGTVISVETHVPFGHNGEIARKTMELVDSPGVGHNFDTANIYYYNPKGIDTVEELGKVKEYVTSVHLKDSAKGEPESFDFPVFGEGIVNFKKVVEILDEEGFTGPYTMELEGPLVSGLPNDERTKKVKGCVDYLKSIGVWE